MAKIYDWNKSGECYDAGAEYDLIWEAMIDWCYIANDQAALLAIIGDDDIGWLD